MPRKQKIKVDPATNFDGLERQLYCWIRQHRYLCAIHKALYYVFDQPILDDFQYDRLEHELIVVEQHHPKIADAVTAEGYDSPNDYVGTSRIPSVIERASSVLEHWKSNGCQPLPYRQRDNDESDEMMYANALQQISQYPT